MLNFILSNILPWGQAKVIKNLRLPVSPRQHPRTLGYERFRNGQEEVGREYSHGGDGTTQGGGQGAHW